MTPKDKILALLAKAEELESKASLGPWKVLVEDDPDCIVWANEDYVLAGRLNDCKFAALSRNSFLPVLRVLVECLDECERCDGHGYIVAKVMRAGIRIPCGSCTPRYAALCAELEKLGVMEKE